MSELTYTLAISGEEIDRRLTQVLSKQDKITTSGILKGDGSGGVTAAEANTDYGTYSKSSGGIPKTDFTSAVQTSLGRADGAVQSSEKGAANGVASLGSNGKVPNGQLPAMITYKEV